MSLKNRLVFVFLTLWTASISLAETNYISVENLQVEGEQFNLSQEEDLMDLSEEIENLDSKEDSKEEKTGINFSFLENLNLDFTQLQSFFETIKSIKGQSEAQGLHAIYPSSHYVGFIEVSHFLEWIVKRDEEVSTHSSYFNSSYKSQNKWWSVSLDFRHPLKKLEGSYTNNLRQFQISYYHPLTSLFQLKLGAISPLQSNTQQKYHLLSLLAQLSYDLEWKNTCFSLDCGISLSHTLAGHLHRRLETHKQNVPDQFLAHTSIDLKIKYPLFFILPSYTIYLSHDYNNTTHLTHQLDFKITFPLHLIQGEVFVTYSWISQNREFFIRIRETDYLHSGFLLGLLWYV